VPVISADLLSGNVAKLIIPRVGFSRRLRARDAANNRQGADRQAHPQNEKRTNEVNKRLNNSIEV